MKSKINKPNNVQSLVSWLTATHRKLVKIFLRNNLEIFTKILTKYIYIYLGPHPWHMEVPEPGTESEPQLQSTPLVWQCQIPQSISQGQESNPCLHSDRNLCNRIPNPLHHSRNSKCLLTFWLSHSAKNLF